ncbi:dienelactone hydrolase family protein [Mucilaginibacter sp. BJC16-A38]|uniref:dienelactone hydrolase family protein n=1 Tax=Mucilaginibacter phenanthrenivorans TaxID=1234842 RepID=UPI0021583CD8|nr:dienelactone hydrolase family protein [Mucilaginibacter phenanthrenivorans]MCR8556106.1 dienelactone hydrolase family protein [Mucilaginibacter phenanthrenivorans]
MEKYVNLKVADGTSMEAYTAIPADAVGKTNPGLILLQEAFGVNHHIRDVADRFAAQGFVVIAPEMYHRTAPPYFETGYDNFDEVKPHASAMTVDGNEADIRAAYHWLSQHELVNPANIFSVGYCMGGRMSFLANATMPIKAGASYYSGNIKSVTDKAKNVSGRHLFFWGGLDKHIGQDQIDAVTSAMDAADKHYINVKFSDADHGFNCDERASYNESAAKEAWALTLAFFRDNM